MNNVNKVERKGIVQTMVEEMEERTNYATRERRIGGDAIVRHGFAN